MSALARQSNGHSSAIRIAIRECVWRGESGYFERGLQAYGREGLPCLRCSWLIVREPFMNRSSYFCPRGRGDDARPASHARCIAPAGERTRSRGIGRCAFLQL